MAAASAPSAPVPAAAPEEFDLVVIGGGSGGLACAKEAKRVQPGAKVALFDFVAPSPHGTKWGLGGTCVNVGCIPKKLMHYAGVLSHHFADAKNLGWRLSDTDKHEWPALVEAVDNYIRSLNFSYKNQLTKAKVTYFNALARLVDAHTVAFTLKGTERTVYAKRIVVATGGRPVYPKVPGAELGITSDDIFWRAAPPGKTLVVGGSYIALECASFLHELGYDTSVMVRSILLRGFDQQAACQIGEVMERDGVRFLRPAVPLKLERRAGAEGPITVTFSVEGEAAPRSEDFDTVLWAVGRAPATRGIGLERAGVKTSDEGFVLVNDEEQTNVPHIYALGDVLEDTEGGPAHPELTPVAIMTGVLLARRLFGGSKEKMNYDLVPTTVFSAVEYGCVGLSQEEAERRLGKDKVEVFVSRYNALESATGDHEPRLPRSSCFTGPNLWARQVTLARGETWEEFKEGTSDWRDREGQYDHNRLLAKLVCDRTRNHRVVGLHYVGPAAGEITQGFALALRLGATKADFDRLVGIHPTQAEEFTVLSNTLREHGASFLKKEGCGGGGACG
jgi:thioredoxin reductase (NADPH)